MQRALFRASSEEPGVDIRSGCGVTSVEAATPGATQAQVVTEGGSSTSHDLVIVADGWVVSHTSALYFLQLISLLVLQP